MSSAPRRRRALGALAIVGLVALVVGGFAIYSTTSVLGEFFGSSGRSSGGHHEHPPVPAAPSAAISEPPATEPGATARVRELEAALQQAVAQGDRERARALQGELAAAQAAWREELAGAP